MKRILSVFTGALFFVTLAVVALAGQPMVESKSAMSADAPAHPKAGETFQDCANCPEMVVVPAGSFMMGSPSSEPWRWEAEGPQHHVIIAYDFAVSKFPITRNEYGALAKYLGADFPQTGRDPAVNISWEDAKAYVASLCEKTGQKYRLLSEAEYEYAERAGTTTAYWWGDSDTDRCKYENGYRCKPRGTVPVGSYVANGFGLYDMSGNVWEWTEDCWNSTYAGAPDDGSAWMSGNCGEHAARGGSAAYYDSNNRSALRTGFPSGDRYNVVGFRVARTL